ncbi:amicyanin [Devosia naphthalenivorans]|uniref:amicyanin n=1 Tax=Devosia naphthalenivorans TaxID=2082392 RepID=UPI000D3BB1F3|nr:amicyanin [Devosia naphthalenivorans]
MSTLLIRRSMLAGLLCFLSPAAPVLAEEYVVTIDQMEFGDVPAELKVGDVIIWRNNDMFRHTATDRDGSFDVDLPPKAEARLVLESAGSIEFYCRLHSGMVGTLTVSP